MEKELDTNIRDLILEYLYYDRRKNPGGFGIERSKMLEKLQLPDNPEIMDFNMLYLEEKDLVKLEKYMGSLWAYAKLTAFGIDTLESRQENS